MSFRSYIDYPVDRQPFDAVVIEKDGILKAIDKNGNRVAGPSSNHASVLQAVVDRYKYVKVLGKLSIDTPVLISKSDLILDLYGAEISVADGIEAALKIGYQASQIYNIKIMGGKIHGPSQTATVNGIKLSGVSNILIRDTTLYYLNYGILSEGDLTIVKELKIDNILAYLLAADGVRLKNTWDVRILNSEIHDCVIGINASGSGEMIISKNRMWEFSSIGVYIYTGNHVMIHDNMITDAQYQLIRLDGVGASRHHSIIANQLVNGSKAADGQHSAILLNNILDVDVRNNYIVSTIATRHKAGVEETTGSDNNIIEHNTIINSVQGIIKVGANTIVRNNKGYATESKGIATISGDGATNDFVIAQHGLAPSITDPSQAAVMCTPASADAIAASPVVCYLSDENADGIYESIRAKFNQAPALGTNNVKVVWEVRYIG